MVQFPSGWRMRKLRLGASVATACVLFISMYAIRSSQSNARFIASSMSESVMALASFIDGVMIRVRVATVKIVVKYKVRNLFKRFILHRFIQKANKSGKNYLVWEYSRE